MDQFDQYQENKQQDKLQELREAQKTKRFGNSETKPMLTTDQLEQKLSNRKEKAQSGGLLAYYLQDSDYLKAKSRRYKSIKRYDDDTQAYAQKYTFHSAKKRAKSAGKASDAFKKAAKLSKKYEEGKKPANALEEYARREEVMMARLEGMKKAAEVKSRDKQHEEYLKGKAELTCYTVLLNLLEGATTLGRNAQIGGHRA